MKLKELFEAYYKPSFLKQSPSSAHGKIRGSVGEWLDGFGASKEDVLSAYDKVKKTPEYSSILSLGMKDVSSQREKQNGTIRFDGKSEEGNSWNTRTYENHMTYKVLAHGKIDASDKEDQRTRSDRAVPKPTVVVGFPEKTVIKTMTNALKRLHEIISKRRSRASKSVKKTKNSVSDQQKKSKALPTP